MSKTSTSCGPGCKVCAKEKILAGQPQSDESMTADPYSGRRAGFSHMELSMSTNTTQHALRRLRLQNLAYAAMLMGKKML